MSYLFFIDRKEKTVLHPDCLKLCPELRVLDEKESLTIILTHDYHSPFNQFPLEDRERKALLHVYGGQAKDEFFKSEKIKLACECYRSLQYNPKIEQIRIYQTQIDRLNRLLMSSKERDPIDDLLKNIKQLKTYIREMEEEVFADTIEEGVIIGKADLSWLESRQGQRDLYLSIMRPSIIKKETKDA